MRWRLWLGLARLGVILRVKRGLAAEAEPAKSRRTK
jgi:hypothetical protein